MQKLKKQLCAVAGNKSCVFEHVKQFQNIYRFHPSLQNPKRKAHLNTHLWKHFVTYRLKCEEQFVAVNSSCFIIPRVFSRLVALFYYTADISWLSEESLYISQGLRLTETKQDPNTLTPLLIIITRIIVYRPLYGPLIELNALVKHFRHHIILQVIKSAFIPVLNSK